MAGGAADQWTVRQGPATGFVRSVAEGEATGAMASINAAGSSAHNDPGKFNADRVEKGWHRESDVSELDQESPGSE